MAKAAEALPSYANKISSTPWNLNGVITTGHSLFASIDFVISEGMTSLLPTNDFSWSNTSKSANRVSNKISERAINDYMVNLKAEIEVRHMQEKIDLLIADQMKTLFAIQKVQMEIMEEIREKVKSEN